MTEKKQKESKAMNLQTYQIQAKRPGITFIQIF